MSSPEVLTGSFDSLLARPDAHVVLDLATESSALLVLFGGIAGGVSMPVFEFFRLTSGFPAKKVFLRDPRRGWYQLGIPGVGDSATAVRDLLSAAIERARAERVVMAGASAGGFAALLFGAWCAADEVIAFSPQTFVDAENRWLAGDTRWPEQIDALHQALATDSRAAILDLLDVLPLAPGKTCYQVHVSTDDPLDLFHAQRIAGRSGVEIFQHDRGGHLLVKTLRNRGLLQPMLLQALSDRTAGSDPQPPDRF
ncbi:MAG: sulfotransferase [Gaiellaceae bacterium]|nr:sulfotransferase [Gaiellaceae bacterium]